MPPGLQELLEGVSAWSGLLWVLFIGGGLALIVQWVRKVWPTLKRAIALVDALGDLPDFMATIADKVHELTSKVHELSAFMERVRHQVENDHDTNLRDEVTEILELANDTAAKVADLSDRQEQIEKHIKESA